MPASRGTTSAGWIAGASVIRTGSPCGFSAVDRQDQDELAVHPRVASRRAAPGEEVLLELLRRDPGVGAPRRAPDAADPRVPRITHVEPPDRERPGAGRIGRGLETVNDPRVGSPPDEQSHRAARRPDRPN